MMEKTSILNSSQTSNLWQSPTIDSIDDIQIIISAYFILGRGRLYYTDSGESNELLGELDFDWIFVDSMTR